MHHTLSTSQSVWSNFDQFWVVFCEELLGDDVISWLCSFRAWNNTFRDLEALNLWKYVIGFVVPKYVYNSCRLKYEVKNILMSGEIIYHQDPRFFELEGDL